MPKHKKFSRLDRERAAMRYAEPVSVNDPNRNPSSRDYLEELRLKRILSAAHTKDSLSRGVEIGVRSALRGRITGLRADRRRPHSAAPITERLNQEAPVHWENSLAYVIPAKAASDGVAYRRGRSTFRHMDKTTTMCGKPYHIGSARKATGMACLTTKLPGRDFIAAVAALPCVEAAHGARTWSLWSAGKTLLEHFCPDVGALPVPATYNRRILGLPGEKQSYDPGPFDPLYALPFVGATVAMEDVMILPEVRLRRGYGYAWVNMNTNVPIMGHHPARQPNATLAMTEWYFAASTRLQHPVVRFGWTQKQALRCAREAIFDRITDDL